MRSRKSDSVNLNQYQLSSTDIGQSDTGNLPSLATNIYQSMLMFCSCFKGNQTREIDKMLLEMDSQPSKKNILPPAPRSKSVCEES